MSRIAVLIPCYNEEKTVAKVVGDYKKTLVHAEIYVFDNNSTDKTAQLAEEAGAIVKKEPRQGKGNVIKSMFRMIDADCYLLVDGDDACSSESAEKMCDLILKDGYDMVIGDRLSSNYFKENKRLFHNVGNRFVRFLVRFLFHQKVSDVMSGYRALSKKFVKHCRLTSGGFEVDTEITIRAISGKARITELPIVFKNRRGSRSKLHTFSDGAKIIKLIIKLFQKNNPGLFFIVLSVILGIILVIVWLIFR